jgi:hypothetical protein
MAQISTDIGCQVGWRVIAPRALLFESLQSDGVQIASQFTSGTSEVCLCAALLWRLGGSGTLFGVGHQSGETRVAMERFEIGVRFDGESATVAKSMVNSLP